MANKPITRQEQFLNGIANDTSVPEPITREEQYLYAIANKGGGGGGSSSADDVTYDNTSSGLTATNVQDAIDEVAQGGGGGESNVERLELVMSNNAISTVKTAAEIQALYEAGKFIYASTNIGAYAQVVFGLFLTPELTGDSYILCGGAFNATGGIESVNLVGNSADGVLSKAL